MLTSDTNDDIRYIEYIINIGDFIMYIDQSQVKSIPVYLRILG
jgi:hypothetical protein